MDEWLCANKSSLNIEKKFCCFSPRSEKSEQQFNPKIREQHISKKERTKYIGIFIDSRLNWKSHILDISKNISQGIGILAKLRHFVSIEILLQIYYAIIY